MDQIVPKNTLICGDATAEMAKLKTESVDLIIADPPYNLGKNYGNNIDLKDRAEYQKFTESWVREAVRLLKPGGSLYCFMGVKFIARLYLMLEEEFNLTAQGWITWHYTQGMGRKKGFSPRHEDILWFSKGDDARFNLDNVRVPQKYYRKRNNMAGANPGDVWQFSHVHYCAAERLPHPTQKPEALLERIIKASSNPGDMVLDPFLGSGTTVRVASVLGRTATGIEINPDYIEMAQTRLIAPFEAFDSLDPRAARTSKDLPKEPSV
ncbi:site-specific DNA-methyltransferase [Sneathiella sp.]|uniref:DNA-methyltransferase n=1 Tax=Sneathiella sp. TaxID=1964365 RepID=UPI002619EBA8|nr:site-specific DNA-methyltransferase [Sneathiella sp.]MDF2367353.1 site-specific DNA-methyltransferase [Sneathiella sp.]